MIFFFNAKGDLVHSLPETIKQGSNRASRIWFFMPTSPTNVVNAYFTLPNGEVAEPVIMTGKNEVPNVEYDNNLYSCWFCDITRPITRYAGKLTVSFYIASDDETITTKSISLMVERGVVAPLNAQTKYTYEQVMEYLATLKREVETNVEANPTETPTEELEKLKVGGITYNIPVGKEIVYVDINDMINSSNYKLFIELSRKAIQEEIIIAIKEHDEKIDVSRDYLGVVMGVTNEINTAEEQKIVWSALYAKENLVAIKLSYTPSAEGNKFSVETIDLQQGGSGGNGTTVTVNGEKVDIFNADTKLDKPATPTAGTAVVAMNKNTGEVSTILVEETQAARPNWLPKYLNNATYGDKEPTGKGTIIVPDPLSPYQSANKHYVDENKGTQLYKHIFKFDHSWSPTDGYGNSYLERYKEMTLISTKAERYSNILEVLSLSNGALYMYACQMETYNAEMAELEEYEYTNTFSFRPYCTGTVAFMVITDDAGNTIYPEEFVENEGIETYAPIPL